MRQKKRHYGLSCDIGEQVIVCHNGTGEIEMTETELELNKYVHTVILGNPCWHKWIHETGLTPAIVQGQWNARCLVCDVERSGTQSNPTYCASLDLTAEAEKKTVEKFGAHMYAVALINVLWPITLVFESAFKSSVQQIGEIVTCGPEPRLLACKRLWDSDSGEGRNV